MTLIGKITFDNYIEEGKKATEFLCSGGSMKELFDNKVYVEVHYLFMGLDHVKLAFAEIDNSDSILLLCLKFNGDYKDSHITKLKECKADFNKISDESDIFDQTICHNKIELIDDIMVAIEEISF